MKKLLLSILLALLPSLLLAQGFQTSEYTTQMALDYDLDSTTFVYPVYVGRNGIVGAEGNSVAVKITTVGGGSTTTTALVASSGPFQGMAVNDELCVQLGTGYNPVCKYIVTYTDANNIVVGPSAWDLSVGPGGGYTFKWWKFTAGGTATDGWVPVGGLSNGNFIYQIDQINTTSGVDYKVECKGQGPTASPIAIVSTTTKTTTYASGNVFSEAWGYCRVGIKMTSTDDGSDVGAAAEKISIEFIGRK